MFEQALLNAPAGAGRAFSTMAGVAAQSLALTAAVLVPIMFPEALPRVRMMADIFAPPPPPPPPPPLRTMLVRTPRALTPSHVLVMPSSMPARAAMVVDPPPAAAEAGSGGIEGGVPGGVDTGVPGGISSLLSSVVSAIRPAAPPPKVQSAAAANATPAAEPKQRITLGGEVQEAKILRRVMPIYPPLARQARISGKVELKGVIGADGRIAELRVISGHPLLVPAALEAVRQWLYRPTHLNGVPVEVEAPIIVDFKLI